MKNDVKFSVRKKLFLFVVLTFTLLIALVIWQIRMQALKVSDQTIGTSLEQSTTILNTVLDGRFYFIKEVASSISKDGRVLPLVFEKDSPTLQDLSLEFKQAFEFDSLFFIDDQGVILARSDRPDAVGRSLRGRSSLFDDALNGKTTRGYIVSQGRILQIIVEPIFDNVVTDVVRGLVASAYALSPDDASQVSKLTQSEVGFFVFTRDKNRAITGVENIYFTDSALSEPMRAFLNGQPDLWQNFSEGTGSNTAVSLKDHSYFSVIKKVASFDGDPLGLVVTLRSRDELMRPFLIIENAVLIVGGLCLLISIVLAIFLSIRISQPLLRLVGIANDIEEGKYPKVKPKVSKANDEIDLLYNSVIKMGNSIKEKNELEVYLAGLANAIDGPPEVFVTDQADVSLSNTDITVVAASTDNDVQASEALLRNQTEGIVLAGELFDGRYKLLKMLGEGLFGKVFLARDNSLNENIAIKIIDKARLDASKLEVDLYEEIKLARRITHRNITRTYDFGRHEKFLYITMEFVDGFTLNKLIEKRGAIGIYPSMIFVKQLCTALNAAHEQGIIHRDLKPQNIGISQQGVLKIMDFGLAVSIKSMSEQQRIQLQKFAAGTPRFMAPEQFKAEEVDERTDVYALGVLMFFIFSGQTPYNAKDFLEYAKAHANAPIPRLHEINPDVPVDVSDICLKAMQKAPDERFQTAKAMLDSLNNVGDF